MSIAQTALAPSKLRQERYVSSLTPGQDGVCGAHVHAAPAGAWIVFSGSSSINMALLMELSRSLIPHETGRNHAYGEQRTSNIQHPTSTIELLSKAAQSHTEANAECRMQKGGTKPSKATIKRPACDKHARRMRYTLVFSSCLARIPLVFSSCSPLVLRWCLPRHRGSSTERMPGFDCAGWSAIQIKSRSPEPQRSKATTDEHRWTQIWSILNRAVPWRESAHWPVTYREAKASQAPAPRICVHLRSSVVLFRFLHSAFWLLPSPFLFGAARL